MTEKEKTRLHEIIAKATDAIYFKEENIASIISAIENEGLSLKDKTEENGFKAAISKLMGCFPGSFINYKNELILSTVGNVYFILSDISTEREIKIKLIEWCSRAACKSQPCRTPKQNDAFNLRIRNGINAFLGVEFSRADWLYIYTYLGNSCNRPLCEKFVDGGFDIEIIRKEKGD